MGDTEDDAGATVPNPYLAAIRSSRERSTSPVETLRAAFDDAVTALESGAWSGGRSDTFASSLTGWRTSARQAGTNALAEFDDAIAGQPEMVAQNAWQVRWRNLGPM